MLNTSLEKKSFSSIQNVTKSIDEKKYAAHSSDFLVFVLLHHTHCRFTFIDFTLFFQNNRKKTLRKFIRNNVK